MLRPQAIAAYASACLLALVGLLTSIGALHLPWLANRVGHQLSLTQYCVGEACESFPSREFCSARPNTCGFWRTATFSLSVAVGLELLVLLAILFSWTSGKRKRTVYVLDILVSIAFLFQIVSVIVVIEVFTNADYFQHGGWEFYSWGRNLLLASVWALFTIKVLLQRFRRIIKGPEDDYDSDDDDEDIDDVSLDEDVPEDDREFHMFNKRARREALLRAEGSSPGNSGTGESA